MDMNRNGTSDEKRTAAPFLTAAAAVAAEDGGLLDLRLQRITDYLDASLHSPQPEVGVVGGMAADLAKVALRLNQSLDEVFNACAGPREYLAAVPHGVETLLKVNRQAERCARLARELARSSAAAEPVAPPQRALPLPPSEENTV